MTPLFSIIIPGFNRVEPLKYTLRSAADAALRLPPGTAEIILVDDGSTPPLAEQLAAFSAGHPITHLRQPNQGSIIARLTGLQASRGQRILFLDSDDLLHPEKLLRHLEAASADIVYDDMAVATLGPDYSATYAPRYVIEAETSPELFFLSVQPAPHNPSYRRDYLTSALQPPLFSSRRTMDPSGDIWLYYNLVHLPARIVKLPAALTAVGPHEDARYSQHWEKLGVAALLIAEAFEQACPATPQTLSVRLAVAETAFRSWRALPHDYAPACSARLLALWQRAPRGPSSRLGGLRFRLIAALLGPVRAGLVYKRLFGNPYSAVRTLDDAALSRLLAESGLG